MKLLESEEGCGWIFVGYREGLLRRKGRAELDVFFGIRLRLMREAADQEWNACARESD